METPKLWCFVRFLLVLSLQLMFKKSMTLTVEKSLPYYNGSIIEELKEDIQAQKTAIAKVSSRLDSTENSLSLDVGFLDNRMCMSSAGRLRRGPNVQSIDDSQTSLPRLLSFIVSNELHKCDFIVALDRSFLDSPVTRWIFNLVAVKQILYLQYPGDFEDRVNWRTTRCLYIILLSSEPELLLSLGNTTQSQWHYDARAIVVGLTKEQFRVFTETKKLRKTEQIIGIVKDENPSRFKVYMNELYWGRRDIARLAYWLGRSFSTPANLFPDKISDLRQTGLNITNFEFQPFVIHRRSPEGKIIEFYGLDVAIVRALGDTFNFTPVFNELPPGQMWGDILSDGTWNGIVGALGSGAADIGIANIFITALQGRREFQEFSTPYRDEKSCFFTRRGQPLPRWMAPSLPFQPITWLVIFAGLLLAGPMLSLLSSANSELGYEDYRFRSLYSSFLYTYGIHFFTPMPRLPLRNSTKVFVAFLWLYAIIIITAYSSNLTAFLTVSREPANIETFKDLYQSKLRVVGQGNFFKFSMARSQNPYLKALSERFTGMASSIDDGKDEVLKGKAALIEARSVLEFYIAQITSSSRKPVLRIMRECYAPYTIGVAYQRNSPLRHKFNRAIRWMFESGLVRRWFLDTIRTYQQYQRQDKATEHTTGSEVAEQLETGTIPLGLDHMEGVFIIYIIGCFFSLISFIIEVSILKMSQ